MLKFRTKLSGSFCQPLLPAGRFISRNLNLKRNEMECPICGSDLQDEGAWGYLALHQSGEILGHTYRCPNHEGFESEEMANDFLKRTERNMEDLGVTSWEEITCDSSMHSVSGSFYTDKQDNLHEGYPC